MKKLVALFLSLIFCWQAVPQNVLAEAVNPLPTAEELAAAMATTGLGEDAPVYHDGMPISKSMTASQMKGWIEEYQNLKLAYIMDTFENYDVELCYVREHYPATFELLKGFSAAGIGLLYDNYSKARDLRDEVAYYHDELARESSRAYTLGLMVQENELDERMKVIYAYQLRASWQTMNSLMRTILSLASGWESEYDRLAHLLTDPGSSGSTETLSWLLEEVDSLRSMDGRSTLKNMTVSASSLRVQQDPSPLSRLARLSPITSALADSEQQMHVMIKDDKHLYLAVESEEGPLSNASISVQPAGQSAISKTTDGSGYAAFALRDIPTDDDGEAQVDISVKADGYRDVSVPQVWITKGENAKIPTTKDDGTAYIKSWTFIDKDIAFSDLEVKLSPYNNQKQRIAIKIASKQKFSMELYFVDKNGKVVQNVGKVDNDSGEHEYHYADTYLAKLSAGNRLEAKITCNGQTEVYRSGLVMTKSDIQKPITGPNILKIIEPGFSFTTPDSWPGPFNGGTIHLSIPIEKIWPIRMALDLHGNGFISAGTTALDEFTKKTKENWMQTPDTKTLNKKVKEAEKKGYEQRALAQTGASWEGERKHSYMVLGGFSFNSSVYGFAAIQVRKAQDNYGQVIAKGGVGLNATVNAEFGIDWGVAALGVYAKLAVTVFPEIGIKWSCYVPDFLNTLGNGVYGFGAFNLTVRLEMGVTARAGIKGACGLTVRGYGFLDFLFRLAPDESYEDKPVELKIFGGFGVKVIVEILWVATYEYSPFGPDWKWRLLPGPVEKAALPQTPVQRFIAFLLASANAEDGTESPEGGKQYDLNNEDLVLHPAEVTMKSGYGGVGKATGHRLFTMQPSGSNSESSDIPMTLYVDHAYAGPEGTFNRTILVSHALANNSQPAVPLLPRNSDGSDAFMPEDGYETIDFDFWVADVSAANLRTYNTNSGGVLLKDVLFTVAILAKDYEEQTKIYDDGTREVRKVPKETYTYVRVWWLNREDHSSGRDHDIYRLEPVVLTNGGTYLAEATNTHYVPSLTSNPGSYPRIFGDIVNAEFGGPMTLYRIVTRSLNVIDDQQHDTFPYAIFSLAQEGEEPKKDADWLLETDDYYKNKEYEDIVFYDVLDNSKRERPRTARYTAGNATLYYSLVKDSKSNPGLFSLGYRRGTATRLYADNVLSIASRNINQLDPYLRMIFMVRLRDDGEHYGLMGLLPASASDDLTWEIFDYDVNVSPTDLYWTTLYGRECLYWLETAGTGEDGSSLFRVRGVWYDATNNTLSETFVLATISTDSESSIPTNLVLAGNNSGFYTIESPEGNRIYRFNFQLVLGTRLVGNVISNTLAEPGTYDDMTLTVYNDGNVPISGLDLVAYDRYQGAAAKAFETIHLDVINPSENRVTLQKNLDGGTEQKTGEAVARQVTSSMNDDDSQFWYRTTRKYKSFLSRLQEETKDLMQTNLIMPGSFASFSISLLLPQSWEGGTHDIYLELEALYTENQNSFSNVARLPDDPAANNAISDQRSVIGIHRDGSVTHTVNGVVSNASPEEQAIYKTDITFESIQLANDHMDLVLRTRRWDKHGTPMVTVVITNTGHLAKASRRADNVVLEAFLDDEETPVFRYSLPEDVSDKETWTLEMPLSLLTDGRSAYKVTLEVEGKNYKERTRLSNQNVIYLDIASMLFITQPEDQTVVKGADASFSVGVSGGVTPWRYQWQVKTTGGDWTDLEGATGATLTLRSVTLQQTGSQYRCVVTDALDDALTSASATLTVIEIPKTGDEAPLLRWLLYTALGLIGLCLILRFRKRKEQP